MIQTLKRFISNEEGLETVEYAVMLGLIVAVLIIAITALGTTASSKFEDVTSEIGGTPAE